MDWTTFLLGFVAGSVLFDVLWRITNRLTMKLVEAQREYITELRKFTGIEP